MKKTLLKINKLKNLLKKIIFQITIKHRMMTVKPLNKKWQL